MKTEWLIRELNKGILYWYPFEENAKILFVEYQQNAIRELFPMADVCQIDNLEDYCKHLNKYDYIVAVHVIEKIKDLNVFFERCKALLDINGKLLFSMDNRLGVRYFCGDRDPYTNRSFDGVENYRCVSALDLDKQAGRIWDKIAVENALRVAGFSKWQRFSVLPNVETPQLLYAQDYLPKEDLSMRYFPMYQYPDSVFLEEAYLYEGLIQNDMFHQMANGYLFECMVDGEITDIKQVTLSLDRGEKAAMATVIKGNQSVYKKALYKQGENGLKNLCENHRDLVNRGIFVVEGMLTNNKYEMPYVNAEVANVYLQNLLRENKESFIEEIDRFRELILKSSEHVLPVLTDHEKQEIITEIPIHKGIWLKRAYFDLVPLNAFYVKGEYVFFDQEFYIDNFPANAIVIRVLDIVYGGHTDLEAILPISFFWKRYEIESQVSYLRTKTANYLAELRNQNQLRVYNEQHRIDLKTVHSNRQKINFSTDEYQKLFVNIFEDLDKYKVYVFGSGNYAKKFLTLYGKQYKIEAVLDNCKEKWGTELEGVKVCSPEILHNIDLKNCKVIICIKTYLGVMQQLKSMGLKHLGVYDTNMIYPLMKVDYRVSNGALEDGQKNHIVKKKYCTGYIAGVFDLYHVGHLNMFKRAKEQCEYLIVGVVSDEGVRKNKKTMPFIPFEERIEMVRSCRYVDEAVEIPFHFCGSRDAYRLYHFDVQFSGSDYENDPIWLAEREYLRKHGSDLVFFPYTEQTSSTKIKALINKQLEEK